jgi:16S rRNA A1518/A1519 N6-dimethyltransferase RsmA/KsgA/DIM1 with predicted DNA glycosylase/AP lyase activity
MSDEWTAPFGGDGLDSRSMAPFATTPEARIEEMISLAHVGSKDCVVDLGSGDGSVLSILWRQAKVQSAVGFEINADLVEIARERLKKEGCPGSYVITNEDVMEVDLSTFTVIFTWYARLYSARFFFFMPEVPFAGCSLGLWTCLQTNLQNA